uniref:Ciliary microtubule inner protein 2B n=1 Tax=Ciona intestinalis TaxID=7719 RepID=H2XN32_CIOIN
MALLPENVTPDLRGSTLAPREPYHVPGYAGYRPQFKYQCSETFGNSTHRLLTSPHVRKSSNTVLVPIDPPLSRASLPTGCHDVPKVYERRRGKTSNTTNICPNTIGFVPKAHFSTYYAKTYPETCNAALFDFSNDQEAHKRKSSELSWAMHLQQTDQRNQQERQTLLYVYSSFVQYINPSKKQNTGKPYFLEDGHPEKNFKSGFAGHVPFYKDLGGQGFPEVTTRALKEFSRERSRYKDLMQRNITTQSLTRPSSIKRNAVSAPPSYSGLIPRYAGYVPGQKFRFGHTFGDSTENPLKLTAT